MKSQIRNQINTNHHKWTNKDGGKAWKEKGVLASLCPCASLLISYRHEQLKLRCCVADVLDNKHTR